MSQLRTEMGIFLHVLISLFTLLPTVLNLIKCDSSVRSSTVRSYCKFN